MAFQRQSTQAEQFPRSKYKESLVAPGLTIDGRIEGAGNVLFAGRLKGEINVKGDLIVERGAHISGEVRAENIVLRGEVDGNIHAMSRVELLENGVLVGDLEASSLTVAAGSRMRGKVDFGRDERAADKVVPIEGGA